MVSASSAASSTSFAAAPRMRLVALGGVVLNALAGAVVLGTNVFRPPPARDRLAGVAVAVAGYTVEDLGGGRHRLHLQVAVTGSRDLDECMAFALDEPFAGRRLDVESGTCVRPRNGIQTVALRFEHLSDDDLAFPSHTLVWGVPGGRCGPILELFGVCVVDQAGTASVELPPHSVLPSFGPIGSFGLLGSFPLFSTPAP
jgi:hypothetical protein